MMDRQALLTLFDREQRRDIEWHGGRREVAPPVVRHVMNHPDGGGFISYSELVGYDVDEIIRREMAYFNRLGKRFEWKVYEHDYPVDMVARLAAHGFETEEPESVMALDLEAASDALWQPVTHDIRRITDAAEIEDAIQVQQMVWMEPFFDLKAELEEELRDHGDGLSIYVGYASGQPVCSAWVRFHPPTRFGSLWGGSTLPQYRKQGFYTAILAARAQEARTRGVRFLTIDASDMSRPILTKHGFATITRATACKWRVGAL